MEEMVSIVIPVYNASKYIKDTIESINKQTYKNYEAIFIDDFSTDNSLEIIKKYQKNNNKIKIIKLKKHRGAPIARNVGIRNAKGRYLSFIDADDILIKNKIEMQVNFIKKNNYEFTYGAFRYMNDKGTRVSKKVEVQKELKYGAEALKNMKILTGTVMIDLYKIPKRYCYMPNELNEDIITWWNILKRGHTAYAENEVYVYYRKTKKSKSSKKLKNAICRIKTYKKICGKNIIKLLHYFNCYIFNTMIKRTTRMYKLKYKEDDIEILISTMNLKKEIEAQDLIKKMKITSDFLVINQAKETEISNDNIINSNQIGISKSRNMAIQNSKNKIILIADDDVIYSDNYKNIIVDAYNKYTNADIISFYIESQNPKRKIKRMKTGRIGLIRSMRVASVEISCKSDRIKEIKFNEEYGAGAKINRGEEQIFLRDARRQKLKAIFVNKKIGEVEQKESSWNKGWDKNYFENQGELYKSLSPKCYKILILQYALRKYNQYKSNLTLKEAIKYMMPYKEKKYLGGEILTRNEEN